MSKQKQNSVLKNLSPEEQSLFEQMKAIITEIDTLQGAGQEEMTTEPTPSEMLEEAIKKLVKQNGEEENGEEENMTSEEDANKSNVGKENNGPTANENAEERIDPSTEANDANLSEVGKALLLKLLANKKSVKKSNDLNSIVTNAVVKAITPIANKITEMEKFNENMLDALGYSESIEKSIDPKELQNVAKTQNQKPVQNVDASAVVNELVNVIKSLTDDKKNLQNNNKEIKNDWNGLQQARADLKTALPFIFRRTLTDKNKYGG